MIDRIFFVCIVNLLSSEMTVGLIFVLKYLTAETSKKEVYN